MTMRWARFVTIALSFMLCMTLLSGTALGIGLAPLDKHSDKSYTAGPVPVEWVATTAVLRAITPTSMVMTATYVLRNESIEDQSIIMGVPKAPYKGQSLGEPVISIAGSKADFRTVKMHESPDGAEGDDKYITWYTFALTIKAGETKGFDISYVIIPEVETDGTYTIKMPLALNRFWDRAPQTFSLTVLLPFPYSIDPAPSLMPDSRREDGAYVWNLPANGQMDFMLSVKDTGVIMQRFFAQAGDDQAKAIYNAYTSRNITQMRLLAEEYLSTSPDLPCVSEVRVLLAMAHWIMDEKPLAMSIYESLENNVGFGESGTFVANKILFDRYSYLSTTDVSAANYLLQTQPLNANAFFEAWIRTNSQGPQITPSPEPTETPDVLPSVIPIGTPVPNNTTSDKKGLGLNTTTIVILVIVGVVLIGAVVLFILRRQGGGGGRPKMSARTRRRRYGA